MTLFVKFTNGVKKRYDVNTLFKQFPDYEILKNKGVTRKSCGLSINFS